MEATGVLVDVTVKTAFLQTLSGAVKDTAMGVRLMVSILVSEQLPFVTVSVIICCPRVENGWDGLAMLAVLPSPKSQR
jgi:hypothetical protein